jgi:hypothetical protein
MRGQASKSVNARPPNKRYTREEMEEMEAKLAEAWKAYGRDREAGRDLYNMYGKHHRPKVDVPLPPTKPWDYKTAALKEKKPCPQTTQIEYPKVVTRQDIEKAKMMSKYTKLDTIPKRKALNDIMNELAELKKERANYIPQRKGVDRKGMITKLQDKFKYANQPTGPDLSPEEEAKIKEAVAAQMRRAAKKNYFGNYGMGGQSKETADQQKIEDNNVDGKFESKALADLNCLFDDVIEEIEERQKYLHEIEELDMEPTKEKVKQEIVSRVAELQKINKMIKEEKEKVNKNNQSTTNGLRK